MNDAPDHRRRRRPGRVKLIIGGVFAAVLAVASFAVAGTANAATQICSNQSASSGGTYYQMWSAGQGSACMTLNSSSSYSSSWSGIGDFVAGVGWNPASTSQSVTYSGSLNANGGTNMLSLYGWSTNPLVEYYVTDGYVGSPNYSGTNMGTMTSDGGTYTIIKHQQVNQPSIQGTTTFWQYLAIRNSPRTSGTITFPNFVSAWASHGMNLGTMNYQIMATEAWGGGSGNSNVTVSHSSGGGGGGGGGTPTPTPTAGGGNGGGGSSGCTATLSAQQQGSNWYNLNVSVTGSNTWTVTVNLVAPAVVYNTWNVSASWPSQYVMTAKSNGSGNNWGFTVSPNGQWTWPSVSCSPG